MVGPIVVAFMTSTHEAADIHRHGLQILPGGHMIETYTTVLTKQGGFTGKITGLRMILNSLILGIGFAVGKIALSMLAAYALVYFRFRFATILFWMIFTTLLLPLEVRILPSYEVMNTLEPDQYLYRPDRAASGIGHGHLLFPAVLQVDPGRTAGSGPHRWRRPVQVLHRRDRAAVENHDRGDLHHHVRLWLEPVSLADADDHRRELLHAGARHQADPAGLGRLATSPITTRPLPWRSSPCCRRC